MPVAFAPLSPYTAVYSAAVEFDRTVRSDLVRAHMALRQAIHAFATEGWADLGRRRRDEIAELPDADRAALLAATSQMSTMLSAIWPEGANDHEKHARFAIRIGEAAALAGERVVAMRMAAQPEDRVAHVSAVLADMILNANLAGRIQQTAILRDREVGDLAPAVAAAVIAHRQAMLGGAYTSAATTLERFGLQKGAALSGSDLRSIAESLLQGLKQADAHVVDVIKSYDTASRNAFVPAEIPARTPSEAIYRKILGEDRHQKPDVRASTLVAFAGSSRGGSTEGRIDGSLDLFRSIVSVARIREARRGPAPTRHALLGVGLRGLSRLDSIVRNERFMHSLVEGRWREIEKEMRFLAQRNPKEAPVVPLPSDMEAIECMALYLQDMVSQGLPMGRVLAEFRHSTHLTFGRTEEEFLLRVTMYAARKYAANFACQAHPKFKEAGRGGMRAEEVVQILSSLEVELRKHERLDDEALLQFGHEQIVRMLDTGTLKRDEAETALELLDDMITRVRAGQEVRYLTGVLALDGTIPDDVIASYAGLPHARRFALAASASSRLFNMYARNGQPMREFQQDVYGRWMRYRQQAPAGRDVVPIQLRFSETRAGAKNVAFGRKPFRRGLGDFMIDVDVEHEEEPRETARFERKDEEVTRKQTAGRRRT